MNPALAALVLDDALIGLDVARDRPVKKRCVYTSTSQCVSPHRARTGESAQRRDSSRPPPRARGLFPCHHAFPQRRTRDHVAFMSRGLAGRGWERL